MANRFTTHFTNSDRSKIYRTSKSKIKNSADVYSVPKGKDKKTEREKIIEKYLNQKVDKIIFCKALDADVVVRRKGIRETARHASKKYKSTLCALNLEEALKEAKKESPCQRQFEGCLLHDRACPPGLS